MELQKKEIPWYVSHEDEVTGPFAFSELVVRAREGQLCRLDLVYSYDPAECASSAGKWTIANEIADLRSAWVRGSAGPAAAPDDGKWVILKVNATYTRVLGPYSSSKIHQLLASGDLSYSDRAWRTGEESWIRIGDCVPLNRTPTDVPAEPSSADGDLIDRLFSANVGANVSADLFKNIARVDRSLKAGCQGEDERPSGAQGEDLVNDRTGRLLPVLRIIPAILAVAFFSAMSVMKMASAGATAASSEEVTEEVNAEATAERKSHSFSLQQEKKACFYSAKKLEALAKKLAGGTHQFQAHPDGWKVFYRAWQRELQAVEHSAALVTTASANPLHEQLGAALVKLKSEAKQMDESFRKPAAASTRSVASSSVDELLKTFARLKAEASQ